MGWDARNRLKWGWDARNRLKWVGMQEINGSSGLNCKSGKSLTTVVGDNTNIMKTTF